MSAKTIPFIVGWYEDSTHLYLKDIPLTPAPYFHSIFISSESHIHVYSVQEWVSHSPGLSISLPMMWWPHLKLSSPRYRHINSICVSYCEDGLKLICLVYSLTHLGCYPYSPKLCLHESSNPGCSTHFRSRTKFQFTNGCGLSQSGLG